MFVSYAERSEKLLEDMLKAEGRGPLLRGKPRLGGREHGGGKGSVEKDTEERPRWRSFFGAA